MRAAVFGAHTRKSANPAVLVSREALPPPPRPGDTGGMSSTLTSTARAHHEAGRLAEAEQVYRQALAAEPTNLGALHGLGLIAQDSGNLEIAADIFTRALALAPDAAGTLHALGYALHRLGRHGEAEARYRATLARDPDNPKLLNNLGNLAKDLGDFAGARAFYDQAIARDPGFAWAHYNRADLHRFTAHDAEITALTRLLAANPKPTEAVYLHFALAKAYGDLAQPETAFDHLLAGNALKRAQTPYDEAAALAALARRPTLPAPGSSTDAPIFIVGMPRAGSTLIEQILSAHPAVIAAGETPAFDQAVANAGRDPQRLADAYLARMPAAPGKRVTDKMPGNFLNLDLIASTFPRARIIHARRDPADTCLSCFAKLFSEGQEFTYDLAELGRYYKAYAGLMDHWRSVLPAGMMLEMTYEDVVADFETQARRLVDFCGLPWDVRCLDFHTAKRAVDTASATQVRQPLYRDAIGRARGIAPRLAPLDEALK